MASHKIIDQTLVRFYSLMVTAVVFVALTSRALPNVVASHFNTAGRVDGFMPRAVYLSFMYAMVIVVPLVLALFPRRGFQRAGARINIPHRDFWLAPVRRDETIAFLSKQPPRFATFVLLFLCYVHWLVVRANQLPVPQVSMPYLFIGFAVLMAATLAWIVWFLTYFRRLPRD